MDVFNRSAHKHALERLAVQPSDRILEIGFGTGQLIGMLAKAASSGFVAGVDPSPLMLSTAWKRNERWIHAGRVDLRLGTASSLAWADGTFDKATALHNFQFWSDPEHDLSEVARVLRPGGLLLLVLRTRDRRSDKHPVSNPLSREGNEGQKALAVLSRCGFEQARLEGEVGTSAVLTAITQVSEYP
jgi:ubiquinone/menaquinone biosynthesis C-methylase UbiE